jgi:hypothetical protein
MDAATCDALHDGWQLAVKRSLDWERRGGAHWHDRGVDEEQVRERRDSPDTLLAKYEPEIDWATGQPE